MAEATIRLWIPPGSRYLRSLVGLGLLSTLAALFMLSLALGSVWIPPGEILTVLAGGAPAKPVWRDILVDLRLPRAITAALAGAALFASGLQMQTLFRNPLAGPFVLGISSGASLGVAVAVLATGAASSLLVGPSGAVVGFGLVLAASLGAAVVLGLVLAVSKAVEDSMTLLILGLMFGYAAGALVSVLVYFSVAERVQTYLIWTFGSYGGVTWDHLRVFSATVLVGLAAFLLAVKSLNALLLGDAYARSMGLGIRKVRFWILLSASLLAGSATAFCGPIAFLGVAVPHLARSLLNTSDHRIVAPGVIVIGASLSLASDLIARLPGSQHALPLNAVTALLGAPVITWVILRRRNLRSSFAA